MKTAMQELIDWTNQYEGKMISADQVVLKAYLLLEKEKEQIMEANRKGVDMVINKENFITGEEYYNQTFNQNK